MRDKGFSENVVGLEFVVNGEKELSKKWQRDKVERLATDNCERRSNVKV